MRKIGSSNSSRVKSMTYTIDNCRYAAWRLTYYIGQGQDWLAQCQNNVSVWDIRSWCWWPGFPVGQHYKFAMSAYCHKLVPVLIRPQRLLGCKTTTAIIQTLQSLYPRPPVQVAPVLERSVYYSNYLDWILQISLLFFCAFSQMATVFPLYFGGDMIYEVRRRNLYQIQGSLTSHTMQAWYENWPLMML